MIDLKAARNLKHQLMMGFDSGGMRAAEALIASIEKEYGSLDAVSPEPKPRSLSELLRSPEGRKMLAESVGPGLGGASSESQQSMGPETIEEWQKAIYAWALRKGWWETEQSFGDMCTLFHAEISEAYEEFRDGHEVTEVYFNPDLPGKPEGIPIELADLVILVIDFCEHAGINLQAAMTLKHAYNETRDYRHGKKRL